MLCLFYSYNRIYGRVFYVGQWRVYYYYTPVQWCENQESWTIDSGRKANINKKSRQTRHHKTNTTRLSDKYKYNIWHLTDTNRYYCTLLFYTNFLCELIKWTDNSYYFNLYIYIYWSLFKFRRKPSHHGGNMVANSTYLDGRHRLRLIYITHLYTW